MTALTLYQSNDNNVTGALLAKRVYATSNTVTVTNHTTGVNSTTATGFSELLSHGNSAAAWQALGSIGPASGHGLLLDDTSMEGQQILAGTWSTIVRCNSSVGSVVGALVVRYSVWNSVKLTYTTIGTGTLAAQTLTTTTTNYTVTAAGLPLTSFGPNDKIYIDVWFNITTNSQGTTTGTISWSGFGTTAGGGSSTQSTTTPGYQVIPTRSIPQSAALLATNTRTIPQSAALLQQTTRTVPQSANLLQPDISRAVPMSTALLATNTRTIAESVTLFQANNTRQIVQSALVCHGQLATKYATLYPAATTFVQASGGHITFNGSNIKLYGTTIYLSTQGGAAAWRTDLTSIIDSLLDTMSKAKLSLVRVTDFYTASDVTQTLDDPVIWKNLDYLVTHAQQMGMFVMLDLSAYKNYYTSQGQDWTVAATWLDLLDLVGSHYKATAPSIAWYNIAGEPAVPANQAGVDALATFYGTLTSRLNASDNGTHLISSGGFTHMNQVVAGLTSPTWWQPIFALAHNDICSVKNYSVNDLTYLSTVQTQVALLNSGAGKPLSVNEFGAQQEQGDLAIFSPYSGTIGTQITSGNTYTSITTQATIASLIIAGTILQLGTGQYVVVAADVSSGVTITINSFVASQTYAVAVAITAIGFADTPHSLADTPVNFYKNVFGTSTTINKWINASSTVTATATPGGDQSGVTSYVAWNLGVEINRIGYDIAPTNQPNAWAILTGRQAADGFAPTILVQRQIVMAAALLTIGTRQIAQTAWFLATITRQISQSAFVEYPPPTIALTAHVRSGTIAAVVRDGKVTAKVRDGKVTAKVR